MTRVPGKPHVVLSHGIYSVHYDATCGAAGLIELTMEWCQFMARKRRVGLTILDLRYNERRHG